MRVRRENSARTKGVSEMELKELKAIADNTINTLLEHDTEKYDFAIDALADIPIRDYTMRYLYEQPEQRETIINALGELSEIKTTAHVHAVRAGGYWLDGKREETEAELKKAISADDQYSLARLLSVALAHGVPAKVWADSLEHVTLDMCLAGAQ